MNSLHDRIEWLERELPPNPPRFKYHDDLPFAILRYDPAEEWDLRREARLLASRLEGHGRRVVVVSLAQLLWRAIEENEGIDTIAALELERDFVSAQAQVNTYLSDADFTPLPDLVAEQLEGLDPDRHICFLLRAASLAPAIYHISKLVVELQGRTRVPTVLFYPGSREGTTGLRFMDIPGRDPPGSYRVKIYG